MTDIALSGLQKSYGGRLALAIENLRIAGGSRCALLGANGSGKSTLLRLLSGFDKADAGSVEAGEPSARGYLPQSPYAFSFSVLANVMMGIRSGDRRRLALDALAAVGMSKYADSLGSRLSGGETQRMALARLLAVPRGLLLLDEPTSATDIAGISLLEDALLSYCERCGCTLVFSTHSPAQAMRLAQRVLFLHEGHIAEDGLAQQVLVNPQSEPAREFLRFWRL